jgi:hypothetical protein
MWRQQVRTMAVGLALIGAACGGDSGPNPIDVQGAYVGTIQGSGSPGQLQLTLVETSGTVTGSGSLSGVSGAVALTVTGNYTEPNVSLGLHAQGFEDINITGSVTTTKITGSANGSGFQNGVVDLTRQ